MMTLLILAVLWGAGPLLGGLVAYLLVLRRRHGSAGVPLPAYLIRAEQASPGLRALVASMARASAKDAMQEWDTLPAGLKEALRKEIGRMAAHAVAEAIAAHNGRRN